MSINTQIDVLLKKGVVIPTPDSILVDSSVPAENIAPGTTLHPFCRISGAQTSIGPDCIIGAEGPATIENCQLGSDVHLAGGYFSGATFLDESSMGSCSHVRPGTLVEEKASAAHAVGLKQTVLFPYVVLGSLINFCDCLMAGGTSRKNHSEVGSSYIHFNYTPHQDKATPSLIGDVPRGVLLDQPPIFLGGQGGLVGPARIAFGAIIPAGIIQRKDILNAGLVANPQQSKTDLIYGKNNQTAGPEARALPTMIEPCQGRATASTPCRLNSNQFISGAYRSIDRIIRNNLVYIGNIYALKMWYKNVRAPFLNGSKFQAACLAGALERLDSILQERINRLDELAGKMPLSIEMNMKSGVKADIPYLQQQKFFAERWKKIESELLQISTYEGDTAERDSLLKALSAGGGKNKYLESIQSLTAESRLCATSWLQSIVDRMAGIWKAE
jgi:UDP-N-acetylglucosamine/UDP-N-acetylgalactosamine diphosphorylase